MATKGTIAGYIESKADRVDVRVALRDRTSTRGMTDRAMQNLEAARVAAKNAGLAYINIVAGKGGGHISHGQGTEWDLVGYNEDGSKWTRAQRVAVALGALQAGANRFGIYHMDKSAGQGTLHIGYSGPGRPAAIWGAGGRVRGDASRQFRDPDELGFLKAFQSGKLFNPRGLTPPADVPVRIALNTPSPRTKPGRVTGERGAATEKLSTASKKVIEGKALIRKGSKGEHVKEVQKFLNEQGYTDKKGRPLKVDGEVGIRTKQAIQAYQADRGLKRDGVIGLRTMTTMVRETLPISPDRGGVAVAQLVRGDTPAIAPDAAVISPMRGDVLASLAPDIAPSSPVVAAAANIGAGMADRFSGAFGPQPIGDDRAAYVRDFDARQQAAMTMGGPLRTRAGEAGIAITGNSPLAGGDVGVTSYDTDTLDTIAAETALFEPRGGSNLGGSIPSYIEEREAQYGANTAFARRIRQAGETSAMRRRFDDAFVPTLSGSGYRYVPVSATDGSLAPVAPSSGNSYFGIPFTPSPGGGGVYTMPSPEQYMYRPAPGTGQTPAISGSSQQYHGPAPGQTPAVTTYKTDAAGRILGGI